jgi:hypothetical protein
MLPAGLSQTSTVPSAMADAPDFADTGSEGGYILAAFAAGMTINWASIFIGNPYTITAIIIFAGLLFTLLWTRYETAWMLLVSLLASNPANLEATVSCNLIFALWLIFLHMDSIQELPRWIYIPNLVALAAVLSSSINWLFFTTKLQPLNQLASMVNYIAGPFLLLPVVYGRIQAVTFIRSKHLLWFLLFPSLLTVLVVYLFGHPVATGLSARDLQTNLFTYSFGNTHFQFIRTQIGFLLASLICASVAIILCNVGAVTRVFAGVALTITVFLLMVTGSIASTIACIGGLLLMLAVGFRYFSLAKYLVFLSVIAALLVSIWTFSPKIVQDYVVKHYEDRLGSKINNADREERWLPSLHYIARNPEGVGWSLYVEDIMVYPHNDYLAYGIAYGVVGALVYASVLGCLLVLLIKSAKAVESQSQLAILLAGIGVAAVIVLNSFSDHLSANRWYYNVVWSIVWLAYFSSRSSVGDGRQEKREDQQEQDEQEQDE